MSSPFVKPHAIKDPVWHAWYDATFAALRDAPQNDRPKIIREAIAKIAPHTSTRPDAREAAIDALAALARHFGVNRTAYGAYLETLRAQTDPPAPPRPRWGLTRWLTRCVTQN